jgi:FkbM family methyltransferase
MSQDLEMSRVMKRVLRSDSTVLDIGAHRGLYIRQATKLAPAGRHIAVEPLPELAVLLRNRFPGTDVHQVAVSDWSGTSDFRRVLVAPGYSGFRRRDFDDYEEQVEIIQVAVKTLDDVVGDRAVRFMKVDVEGAELEVLRGARQLLERHRPYVVMDGFPGEAWEEFERAGMVISNPVDWLAGMPPLSRSELDRAASGGRWSFLAHAPDTTTYS